MWSVGSSSPLLRAARTRVLLDARSFDKHASDIRTRSFLRTRRRHRALYVDTKVVDPYFRNLADVQMLNIGTALVVLS